MLPRVKKMWDEYRHRNYLKLNGGEDPCAAIRLRAEQAEERCKRLEEALREITSLYWQDAPCPQEMRDIARKALEDK